MMYLTVLSQVVAQYSNAEVVWVQEEPKNMGAWLYVKPRLDTAMRELFGGAGAAHTLSADKNLQNFRVYLI